MPLKTNVGLSRKVADNNFGSRGASVNLEVELDSSLLQEPERLLDRIRQVFRLAQRAVDEELSRQDGINMASHDAGNGTQHAEAPLQPGPAAHATPPTGNGRGNGAGNGHAISEKQMTYLRQLAKQLEGLGVRRLETLAQRMYGRPLAALTSLDASGMIDTLKSIKAGQIDLQAVLAGEAT
jgi:hypothetical protein